MAPQIHMDFPTIARVQQYLNAQNPYVPFLRNAADLLRIHGVKKVVLQVTERLGRRYAVPEANEIAVFVQHDYMSAPNQFRSVLLCNQQQGFYSINEYNPLYDPLHYVLMFPRGEHGYALQDASGKRIRVSPLQHYQ
jgi:hypothetical protein